jgi:hypothetical protein
MIQYYHGVSEYWSTGVMVEMKNWLANLFLSDTPWPRTDILTVGCKIRPYHVGWHFICHRGGRARAGQYSITPLLQSVKDSLHEKFGI